MSFTADELQSFNDILEKKLAIYRHEMERTFDQRLQLLRREIEQRFIFAQQEILRSVTQRLTEHQQGLQTALSQKFNAQQISMTQALISEMRQRQQQQQSQLENIVDRALAAQLLAIEELLNQRPSLHPSEDTSSYLVEQSQPFEAIEVQTELPWEDLLDIFGKALDERFATLHEATQAMMRSWKEDFSTQLAMLQTQSQMLLDVMHAKQPQAYTGSLTSMQEVFQSIEQLEHIIESMQIVMTSNHTLLYNRLYHHQQLPLERAHATNHKPAIHASHPNGTSSHDPLSLTEEREGK